MELDKLRISKPCKENWDEMTGDNRSRFCGRCRLHVYQFREMTENEIHQLIKEKEGKLCVRIYARQDGSYVSQDCGTLNNRIQRRFATSILSLLFLVILGVQSRSMMVWIMNESSWFFLPCRA